MSDARLRELEIAFKREPTNKSAKAYTLARWRAGDAKAGAYRLIRFDRKWGQTWRLQMIDLVSMPTCEHCSGEPRPCNWCAGSGVELTDMEMGAVNAILEHLHGRFLLGRFRFTPTGKIRWVGP